jgi:hypothetical protein
LASNGGKAGFNRADVAPQRSEAHKPEKTEEEFKYDLSIDVVEAWQLARGDESVRDYNEGQERLFQEIVRLLTSQC